MFLDLHDIFSVWEMLILWVRSFEMHHSATNVFHKNGRTDYVHLQTNCIAWRKDNVVMLITKTTLLNCVFVCLASAQQAHVMAVSFISSGRALALVLSALKPTTIR